MRRTRVQDYKKINEASDLDLIVKDKRKGKRANKQKAKRRNRRYENNLLKHLAQNMPQDNDL